MHSSSELSGLALIGIGTAPLYNDFNSGNGGYYPSKGTNGPCIPDLFENKLIIYFFLKYLPVPTAINGRNDFDWTIIVDQYEISMGHVIFF